MIAAALAALGLGPVPLHDHNHEALRAHLDAHHFEADQSSSVAVKDLEAQIAAERERCNAAKKAEADRVATLIAERKQAACAAYISTTSTLVKAADGDKFTRAQASKFADAWQTLDKSLLDQCGSRANPGLLVLVFCKEAEIYALADTPLNLSHARANLATAIERGEHPAAIADAIELVETAVHAAVASARPSHPHSVLLARANFASVTLADAALAVATLNDAPPAPTVAAPGRLLERRVYDRNGNETRLAT